MRFLGKNARQLKEKNFPNKGKHVYNAKTSQTQGCSKHIRMHGGRSSVLSIQTNEAYEEILFHVGTKRSQNRGTIPDYKSVHIGHLKD